MIPQYHSPVLLDESVEALNIDKSGIYVDATYGGGGHSAEVLKRLGKSGRVLAFDRDMDSLSNKSKDKRLKLFNENYSGLSKILLKEGCCLVSGLIADLGVSSHQLDTAKRGFSFRFDSNLDMRMNQKSSKTATEVLNTYSIERLAYVFKTYGEIHNASKLSRTVSRYREKKRIETTKQFLDVIKKEIKVAKPNQYFAKVFQSLRIEVNNELEDLKSFLAQGVEKLKVGGRFVVITYHSLEDRIVKRFFRDGTFEGVVPKDEFGNKLTQMRLIGKYISPSSGELQRNNRARSGKLRIGEKIK